MAEDSKITLLEDVYSVNDITTPESREKLNNSLAKLNQHILPESELRRYFEGLKIIAGIFIQKVFSLETDILELKRDQITTESRMEAMYLKAQLEIQELRSEISEIKLSKGRINQIVKVAKALQGNAYAPYAVKSLVDGVINPAQQNSKVVKLDITKLPSDFTTRLEFAQQNGFKWNKNNRIPNKATKQLEILEEWENQFCEVENMTIEQILNKSYVVKVGPGAVAGALMLLERELGALLPERKTLSVFNCYQKAIKNYSEKKNNAAPIACNFDIKKLISDGFCYLPEEDIEEIEKRFKTRVLATTEQVISAIKKTVSKNILPSFIDWGEKNFLDIEKLYAIQNGAYDNQLRGFIEKYYLGD